MVRPLQLTNRKEETSASESISEVRHHRRRRRREAESEALEKVRRKEIIISFSHHHADAVFITLSQNLSAPSAADRGNLLARHLSLLLNEKSTSKEFSCAYHWRPQKNFAPQRQIALKKVRSIIENNAAF